MSLSKRYLLGMDLGTTNVKGIIMDEDGNIVHQPPERMS